MAQKLLILNLQGEENQRKDEVYELYNIPWKTAQESGGLGTWDGTFQSRPAYRDAMPTGNGQSRGCVSWDGQEHGQKRAWKEPQALSPTSKQAT